MLTTLFRAAALGALLLLAACDRQSVPVGAPIGEAPKSLRVYQVPADRAEGLLGALAAALGDNGRVSLAPPDRLIVVAPVSLQTAVAENLGELLKAAGPVEGDGGADNAGPVRVVAWIVDVADTATVDPRLKPLQTTLDAVRETLGAPGFSLHAQLAVTANVERRSRSASTGVGGSQLAVRLSPATGGTHAEISVRSGQMGTETRTLLKFGETVVLAQAMPEDEGGSRIRLVIVRADPA